MAGDQARHIKGYFNANYLYYYYNPVDFISTPPFYLAPEVTRGGTSGSGGGTLQAIGFDNALSVRIGSEGAPTNMSTRLMRRVA